MAGGKKKPNARVRYLHVGVSPQTYARLEARKGDRTWEEFIEGVANDVA